MKITILLLTILFLLTGCGSSGPSGPRTHKVCDLTACPKEYCVEISKYGTSFHISAIYDNRLATSTMSIPRKEGCYRETDTGLLKIDKLSDCKVEFYNCRFELLKDK